MSRLDGATGPDFYRTVWGEAAAALGLHVREIGGQYFEVLCPDYVLRVNTHVTSLDDAVTVAIAADKPLVHDVLARRGVPVPTHVVCDYHDVTAAWSFADRRGRVCVVKPARGTGGGTGITTSVSSRRQLVAAMGRAGSYCPDVLVEEQISGDNYRLLYLDGVLIEALMRRPPALLGDGTSSVKDLASKRISHDAGAMAPSGTRLSRRVRRMVAQTGMAAASVPAAGEAVPLRPVIAMDDRQDNESVTDSMCEEVVKAGAAAAAALGVRLAGVDVITPDRSMPLGDVGGAVIEVNTGPGLHYHYMTESAPTPVASIILKRLCGLPT